MPVIAFANSKGGSGKTTSALLLACELANAKAVTLIDADPRHPISRTWAALPTTCCWSARVTVALTTPGRAAGERTLSQPHDATTVRP